MPPLLAGGNSRMAQQKENSCSRERAENTCPPQSRQAEEKLLGKKRLH